MTITISDNVIIPKQKNWLNKDYTEMWNAEVLPLYLLCLQQCKILEAGERYGGIVAVKFETSKGDIINFYPHWLYPKINNEISSYKFLIEYFAS